MGDTLAMHEAGLDQASLRLRAATGTILNHLRAGLVETGLSREEWRVALDFLAEAGRYSDRRRQEIVLLSDVLGLSALVEALNARRPEGATPNTFPDPFYLADAPLRRSGTDLRLAGDAPPLDVALRVRAVDGCPVAGAVVEAWQANAAGVFDNQDPDNLPEHNLRGVFRADAKGRVVYRTERPGRYVAPTDGPAGRLLARLGRGAGTPAHLSFRVAAPGFDTLATRIFDAADPTLGADAVFAVRAGLATDFAMTDEGWRCAIALTLAPADKEIAR